MAFISHCLAARHSYFAPAPQNFHRQSRVFLLREWRDEAGQARANHGPDQRNGGSHRRILVVNWPGWASVRWVGSCTAPTMGSPGGGGGAAKIPPHPTPHPRQTGPDLAYWRCYDPGICFGAPACAFAGGVGGSLPFFVRFLDFSGQNLQTPQTSQLWVITATLKRPIWPEWCAAHFI